MCQWSPLWSQFETILQSALAQQQEEGLIFTPSLETREERLRVSDSDSASAATSVVIRDGNALLITGSDSGDGRVGNASSASFAYLCNGILHSVPDLATANFIQDVHAMAGKSTNTQHLNSSGSSSSSSSRPAGMDKQKEERSDRVGLGDGDYKMAEWGIPFASISLMVLGRTLLMRPNSRDVFVVVAGCSCSLCKVSIPSYEDYLTFTASRDTIQQVTERWYKIFCGLHVVPVIENVSMTFD